MSNKNIALDFLKTCALENPELAFKKHVHPNFKHHNQYFKGDAQSLMIAMIEAGKNAPNRSFNVKQIFETDDRVAVYSEVVKDQMTIAVVHMMRFENEKIAEMWDVGQVINKDSPNENGMF